MSICQCWLNKFSSRWRPIISLWVVASPSNKAFSSQCLWVGKISAISALMSERTEGVSQLCVKSQLTLSSNITCQGVLPVNLFLRSREDCYAPKVRLRAEFLGGSHALRLKVSEIFWVLGVILSVAGRLRSVIIMGLPVTIGGEVGGLTNAGL